MRFSKTVLFAVPLLTVLSTPWLAAAQNASQHTAPASTSGPSDGAKAELRAARSMMISGVVLTSLGVVGELVGASILISGAAEDHQEGTMGPAFAYLTGGIVMGVSALPLLTGIPLWAVGSSKMKRLRDKTAFIPSLALRLDTKRGDYLLNASWSF